MDSLVVGTRLSSISGLAIIILGICGAAGVFSTGAAFGGALVSFSVSDLVGKTLIGIGLGFDELRGEKRMTLLSLGVSCGFLVLGSLGCGGILSASQIGWATIGTYLTLLALSISMFGYWMLISRQNDHALQDMAHVLPPPEPIRISSFCPRKL